MTYKRFEDLPVWQTAVKLAEMVDDFSRSLDRGVLTFSQRDQIERASLSVSNNIAEGFERGTSKELIASLCIASGSSGEVWPMTHFLKDGPYFTDHRQVLKAIRDLAKSCSKQLSAWANHLQNSEIEGRRHLTDRKKEAFNQDQKATSFLKFVNDSLPDGHPAKRPN